MRKRLCFLFIFWVFQSGILFASQRAKILQNNVEVHEAASSISPLVATLPKGVILSVSSNLVRDEQELEWYKVKLPSGVYGYVLSHEVATFEDLRAFSDVGFAPIAGPPDEGVAPWGFVIRGMLLGGAEFFSGSLEWAGEGEFSFCLPLASHGYLHRFLSLGANYISFQNDPIASGVLVFRIYQESRMEPEIRLRLGTGLQSSSLEGGGSIGLNYPLSLYYGTHFSFYFEVSAMTTLTGSPQFLHLWGSTGLGLHF